MFEVLAVSSYTQVLLDFRLPENDSLSVRDFQEYTHTLFLFLRTNR